MTTGKKKGVSVIICCYNSRSRLTPTLQALADQQFTFKVDWEIILVDNASTDGTASFAAGLWDSLHTGVLMQTVYENQAGQGFARKSGLNHARFEYVLFCDDDNWLSKNYVEGIFEILDTHPTIGACGGKGVAVFEKDKPEWFDEYAEAYATGPQDITNNEGRILNLYGAGLGVRVSALNKLSQNGFKPLLNGRAGQKLSSSDDTEMTYALVLSGYELAYDEGLSFQHYLPASRLTLDYLGRLYRAFGNDGPVRNLYYSVLSRKRVHQRIKEWNFHFILSLVRLVKYGILPPKKNGRAIYFHWNMAYISELLNIRKHYPVMRQNILAIQSKNISPAHVGNITAD